MYLSSPAQWLYGLYNLVADPVCEVKSIPASSVIIQSSPTAYDKARGQWASAMGSRSDSDAMLKPTAIVFIQNEEEVLQVIEFAQQCDYKLSVRSGGHQYSGYSSCKEGERCIQLDVSGLNKRVIQGTTVTLGAGNKLDQVYDFLVANDIFLPLGDCQKVGLGGHLQTSSVGFLSKSFGLGMDHVSSFRLATAANGIVAVNPDNHPDLYKAVLGGGPGSWGVILDFTLEAYLDKDYPAAAVHTYHWTYSHDLFVKLINRYLAIAALPEISRDLEMVLSVGPDEEIGNYPPLSYTHYIVLYATWTGRDGGTGPEQYLKQFTNIEAPFKSYSKRMPVSSVIKYLTFDFKLGDFRYHAHSLATNTFDNPDFAEIVATEIDERLLLPTYYTELTFQNYGDGGKGSQVQRYAGKNAYAMRDAKVIVDDWNFFLRDEQAEVAKQRISNFRNKTETAKAWTPPVADLTWMSTDTSNAQKADIKTLWRRYYPSRAWFEALQSTKLRVDPCDLFHTDMTVPLPGSVSTCPLA